MAVVARLVPSYTVAGVAVLKPVYYDSTVVVCLSMGLLVSKVPISTDLKVYVTSAGSLIAKTAAAGAEEKQVMLLAGALVT